MRVEGIALVVPGDDVDTDVMYPGAYLNVEDPEQMAQYLFEGFDPTLRERLVDGTILVVGANFGIGSSREHVPLAMKGSGIRGVVGRSFARIFYRNCVNLGLAIAASPGAVDAAHDGSRDRHRPGGSGRGRRRRVRVPAAPPLVLELGAAGGLVGLDRLARRALGGRGRNAERARPRPLLAPPDQLVGVERDPDRGDERERGEGGYRQRDGNSATQATAATVRPRPSVRADAVPEQDVGEQVERAAAAERQRGDRVELAADVGERHLHREREQHDPAIIGRCRYVKASRASAMRSAPWRSASSDSARSGKKSK